MTDHYLTPAVKAIVETQSFALAFEMWIKDGPPAMALGRTKTSLECMDLIGKTIARETVAAEVTEARSTVVGLFEHRRGERGWHPCMGKDGGAA